MALNARRIVQVLTPNTAYEQARGIGCKKRGPPQKTDDDDQDADKDQFGVDLGHLQAPQIPPWDANDRPARGIHDGEPLGWGIGGGGQPDGPPERG